ncbi:MAG: DUF1552 domain-containing protein [Gemmatimonadota bacterium]|nr:DUF1552 domain-containing protein [Gemmatimonadota bacterium]MDE3013097.1 DUF1552 domain-containing protein [Gemmatimonadota bacterium]
MHFITGKHIERRTFLKGMGATIGLPMLDAMTPAGRARASSTDQPKRLVCIEEVHGVAGCNDWASSQHLFAPETVGRDFELLPGNVLASLEPHRDDLTIVSNTDVRMAEAFTPPEIGGDHFRSSAVFLTQSHPKQTQGSDLMVGTSLDQIHAQRFGQDTVLPSLQLCIEPTDKGGGCDYNYSCSYTDSISWSSPETPLPMIRSPRAAFDLLFGAGGTEEERALRRRTHSSILDWVAREVAHLKREVGVMDRQRIDRYLGSVREIERRIQMIEGRNNSGEPRDLPGAPPGVPDSFSEHMQLMFDLQVLAFETDITRVTAFKTGRDASNRTFPESGSDRGFHPASHHGGREERILEFNKICQYRVSQLAYFVERLKTTADVDGTLLDNTVVLWGSPMGDANLHNHRRCPLIFLGGGNGVLDGGTHYKAPDGTPMANVFLTLLHRLGHEDLRSFGDSTGEFLL